MMASKVVRNPDEEDQPLIGIKFSFIVEEFLPRNGGEAAFEGLTTTEVVARYIQPHTRERQESYCDMLKRQGHQAYGTSPSAFVSHAHKYRFLDVISALKHHLRADWTVYVFLDVFCINQHRTCWSYKFLSTTFYTSIETCGRTIAVMSPWNDPLPFTRAWCIYEAYCTAVTKCTYEIALSQNEKESFLASVKGHHAMIDIDQLLSTIRAEKSQAFHPEERDRIHSIIHDKVGFEALNKLVFEQYRKWVIDTTVAALEDCTREGDREERGRLLSVLGILYLGQGDLANAERYAKGCLEQSRVLYGEMSPDTMTAMYNLAQLYDQKGDFTRAEVLHEDCLRKRRQVLGDDHRKTDVSIYGLALVYHNQGKFKAAETLYLECLEHNRDTLGDDHRDTLVTMNGLALNYLRQGKYDDAKPLYVHVLDQRRNSLGNDNPNTMISVHNLALLYHRQGDDTNAEPMYIECLKQRTMVLGADNPRTLTSMSSLGVFYVDRREYKKAEPLLRECLERRSNVLGRAHPFTLTTMGGLAIVEKALGNYQQAEVLFVESFEKSESTLGEGHPETWKARSNLGDFYYDTGDYSKAEPLEVRGLELRRRDSGDMHESTILATHNLAALYKKLERFTEAESLFVEALEKRQSTLGEGDPNTLYSMTSLAQLYCLMKGNDNEKKADNLFIKCLETQRTSMGDESNTTFDLALAQYKDLSLVQAKINLEKFLEQLSADSRFRESSMDNIKFLKLRMQKCVSVHTT